MLEKMMIEQLNQQMNRECYSIHLYLQMSVWCMDQGLSGTAHFLQQCAQEEYHHLQKFLHYISATGALPVITTIQAPPYEFTSLHDLLQQIYEHAQAIADKLGFLAHQALTLQDYPTFNFIQLFIAEQQQEEQKWRMLLDRLEMTSEQGPTLLFIDRELGKRSPI